MDEHSQYMSCTNTLVSIAKSGLLGTQTTRTGGKKTPVLKERHLTEAFVTPMTNATNVPNLRHPLGHEIDTRLKMSR